MKVAHSETVGSLMMSVYQWNGKYIIKYETPFAEQTFKVKEMDFTGGLSEVIAQGKEASFIEKVEERFREMLIEMNACFY